MKNLRIVEDSFYLGEEPFQIFSGAIHYFRCAPGEWRDRLEKLKLCGFNTVETYVAWNLHEPREGEFCFDGICDLERFLSIAQELGLYAILRPGPYICAEWDFGGFPAWLKHYPEMKLRCSDPLYMEKVNRFFDALIPRMLPHLTTNGGNILMVQVENEYGSFGCDKTYLAALRDGLIRRGVDVPLFVSDGAIQAMMSAGCVEGALETVNFGSNPEGSFAELEKFQPNAPKMCMEYWCGWFDHWEGTHVERDAESVAEDIRYMKEHGCSFNVYMFYGGTNFGFTNGANYALDDDYCPTTTSYDYNAFLDEAGEPTEKYWAVKAILNPEDQTEIRPRSRFEGRVELTECARLFENLDNISCCVSSPMPMKFDYGFMLSRGKLTGPLEKQPLQLFGLHDRAQVFLDGKEAAVIYRRDKNPENPVIELEEGEEVRLDILVENMGRINYGYGMGDNKGILDGVFYGEKWGHYVMGFENYALPLEDISGLDYREYAEYTEPVFLRGSFMVENPGDTFLSTEGFGKGVAFVNGFNIGRYWEKGPQTELYIPASLLKPGENKLVLFELHHYGPEAVLRASR